MTSKKERRRARRRAETHMDQAFEALQADNPTLAKKLSQRAVDLGFMNPRLWLDHGEIHHGLQDLETAEAAYRQSIALAPTYAEAFAALARLQAERGKFVQAERLQRRAVELRPGDAEARERLAGYLALAGSGDEAAPVQAAVEFSTLTDRFDWDAVAARLTDTGMAHLPALLQPEECAALIALWNEECFEHRVDLDHADDGRVSYRFFTRPLPALVARLREEVYARLAPIANRVQEELGRSERYPAVHADFLARCHDAGQGRSTPILLRYPSGGFNAPHRDIAGAVVFPFQLAVTLGPGCSAGGDGGALRLVDQRGGKRKLHERRLETGVGDGALFCTRERLVRIGGVQALQPVLHGVTEVRRERFALGVPFHEHG